MKKETIALISFLVFYTSVLFGGFSWMLKSQIQPIKGILTNHITDTNKKIDRLTDRIDKLNDRIDKQSDQFNTLYELLLKEKQNQSSK